MPMSKLVVDKDFKKLMEKKVYENEHSGVRKCFEGNSLITGNTCEIEKIKISRNVICISHKSLHCK